ncbi:phosphatidylglycerophosphatase A family protein [Stagnihabitans tardus]|uniref:Phosphatidylglycerophosphatase A n=1 Tax=Stagnihabitans tardus TaxID=2699202 RepID=A0AAE4Y9S2_9RHOB|nr:phosphatidylglycerophosphatase A [Stagnihabitans tardus]NBZ86095.1 phosphatidylglycerophosphatase A [Stagnihabitans tardus]
MVYLVSTVFGIGKLRPAPGTWASLASVLVGVVLFKLSFWVLLAATVLATALGFWACRARLSPGEDPSEVVIDEVAGQWLALLFPTAGFTFSANGAAFLARMREDWTCDSGGLLSQAACQVGGAFHDLPWPAWVFAFALFRLFDIWKPWLVGRADRKGTPDGVMEDDLWAGLFAGLASVVLAALYHIPLVLMR